MGLSIASLVAAEKEIVHDVELKSLDGETIKMREMRNGELSKLFEDYSTEDGTSLNEEGTKRLLMATITDDEGTKMTQEQADQFFDSAQKSIITEIIQNVNRLHGGTGSGES